MSAFSLQSPAGGQVTVTPPSTAANRVVTLPNASGRLLTTEQVQAFSAVRTIASAAANALVRCDSELFDYGNCYDPVTGYFQPTVPGIYAVTAIIRYTFSTAGNVLGSLYLNGALYYRGTELVMSAAGNCQAYIHALIPLNGTTDYVYPYSGCAGTATVVSGVAEKAQCQFFGHLVRLT